MTLSPERLEELERKRAFGGIPTPEEFAFLISAARRAEKAEADLRSSQDEISAAIGTTEFMDPPDGGDASLAEQVRRIKADLRSVREASTTPTIGLPTSLGGPSLLKERGRMVHSPSAHTHRDAGKPVLAGRTPHPFAVGERVRCVRGGSRAGWSSKLVACEEYIVVETSDNGWMQGINLDDPRLPPGVPHYAVSRFVAAQPASPIPGYDAEGGVKPKPQAEGEG